MSEDASTRLHRICDALSELADESPFTREEWDRIDRENVALAARLAEAIDLLGWAEARLLAFGQQNSSNMDNVMMMDEIKLFLLRATPDQPKLITK